MRLILCFALFLTSCAHSELVLSGKASQQKTDIVETSSEVSASLKITLN